MRIFECQRAAQCVNITQDYPFVLLHSANRLFSKNRVKLKIIIVLCKNVKFHIHIFVIKYFIFIFVRLINSQHFTFLKF